jgi:hypothetical protein
MIPYVRVVVILPFIILVRITAKLDPHAFRYWAVDSMEYWRRWGHTWSWKAYAIALAGWAIVFSALYLFLRWLL